jgi:hypothetical protein
MGRPKTRKQRRRSVRRRRTAAAAVGFYAGLVLLFPAVWPTLPFPHPAGMLATFALGLLFGLVAGAWRALVLTLLVLPAAAAHGEGIWAGIVAMFTAGPAAYLGLLLGVGWTMRRVTPLGRSEPDPPAPRERPGDTGSFPSTRPRRRTPVPAR